MMTFGTGQGYLKAGFLGFTASGKTHTATLLAVETRKLFDIKTPIACFDTEATMEYVAQRIKRETGMNPIGEKSRSLADLMKMCRECEEGAAEIVIVDSMTHVWTEVCEAYMKQVNDARDARRLPRRNRLEFQDWNAIKGPGSPWQKWQDYFLNSKLHIIICGRAQWEWDFEETEGSTGETRKELVKTGVKMRASDFGFEPSLLVQMERISVMDRDSKRMSKAFVHHALVIKDRYDVMDSAEADNPPGEFFLPHLQCLVPGAHNAVDTNLKTDMGVDEAGQAAFDRERKDREALLAEIQATIVEAYPGQSAVEKKLKIQLLDSCFGCKSWETVCRKDIVRLREDFAAVAAWIKQHPNTRGGKDGE